MSEHEIEIMRFLGNLEGKMDIGFEGVHRRLDISNGRIGKLEEQVDTLESTDDQQKGAGKALGGVWKALGGVGAVAGGLALISQWLTK